MHHVVWNHDPLARCHNERDGIWNHRCVDCLLSRLFRHRSKKTSTPRVTGLCERNPPIDDVIMRLGQLTVCSHYSSDYQRMQLQTSALTVLYEGNTRVTSGFSLQRVSNMENILMSWRHHGETMCFAWHMYSFPFGWYCLVQLQLICLPWSDVLAPQRTVSEIVHSYPT